MNFMILVLPDLDAAQRTIDTPPFVGSSKLNPLVLKLISL
jgi:hypothetical protein